MLKKTGPGKYHFVRKAGDGETVATSESYTTEAAAKNGIESVKTNASGAKVDDETDE